jgi:hypothetical protein
MGEIIAPANTAARKIPLQIPDPFFVTFQPSRSARKTYLPIVQRRGVEGSDEGGKEAS